MLHSVSDMEHTVMTPNENDLLTVSHVARELETSEGSVRRRADIGELPCVRTVSGERLFRAGDIARVRTAQSEKSRS
jgi:hypothetical protein